MDLSDLVDMMLSVLGSGWRRPRRGLALAALFSAIAWAAFAWLSGGASASGATWAIAAVAGGLCAVLAVPLAFGAVLKIGFSLLKWTLLGAAARLRRP